MSSRGEGALAAGALVGHYQILRLLGRGGMGEVYLAADMQLKRQVALKILPEKVCGDPIRLKRFEREATSAAALNHPNICTVYEVGNADGTRYISMEYCDGQMLSDRIASRGHLSPAEATEIGIQIANALEAARKKKVVHRDLKPGNVLLMENDRVKVVDFGLACREVSADERTDAPTESHLTVSGIIVGTVAYMSPEQALGKEVDHRSDLFSLGVLLYEMLSGRRPFEGPTAPQIIDHIIHSVTPAVASSAPEPLKHLVEKLLQKNPDDRYQTARDVLTELEYVQSGSRTARSAAPAGKPLNLLRPAILVLATAIAVGAALLWYVNHRPSRPGAGDVSPARIESLVAVPCKVYGAPEMAYLTDAVPSTLSTALAEIRGLETKVPPTSVEFEKIGGDLARVADAYEVSSLLLSTIHAEPSHFELTVELVNPKDRKLFWSKSVQGTPEQYIEMTRRAADEIREALRPGSLGLKPALPTRSKSQAELAFRQGLHYSYSYNNLHRQEDFDRSFAAFQRALQWDPEFADAAGEIATLYIFQVEAMGESNFRQSETEKWAKMALQLDARNSRGWQALAAVEAMKPDPQLRRALEYALKAGLYRPDDAMACQTVAVGMNWVSVELGIAASRRAHELDPLYLYPMHGMAASLMDLNQYDDALNLLNEVLEIEPAFPWAHFHKAIALSELNRLAEAQKELNWLETAAKSNQVPPFFLLLARVSYFQDSRRPEAEETVRQLLSWINDRERAPMEIGFACEIAAPALAKHGRDEAALQVLEAGERQMAIVWDLLESNRHFNRLRSNARFARIRAAASMQFKEAASVLNEARARRELPQYLEKPLLDLQRRAGLSVSP